MAGRDLKSDNPAPLRVLGEDGHQILNHPTVERCFLQCESESSQVAATAQG
jgi:hypothetical protein